jgi:hypothetical protein
VAASSLKVRLVANICGIGSILISLLYWACILLPKPYWPFVCPWGHSMERFAGFMVASLVLGIVAAWKGPRWCIGAVALAFISLLLGTSSF